MIADKATGKEVKCPKCSTVVKVPVAIACPDDQVLKQFLLGQATDPSAEQVEQHLDQCDRCVDTLHELQSEDTLIAALRQEQAAVQVDEQVEKVIDRMCTLRPAAAVPEQAATPGGSPKTPALDPASDCGEEVYDFLAPPQGPGEIGRLGPYRILKLLGAGGMGIVFQAEDPQLERLVALKAMIPALAASATHKKRFLREAKSAAAIKHDHIVSIYQVGEDRGIPYLAMEFLKGEALDKRLEREERLPLADVLRIGRDVASGLAAAHEGGMIHRDIKPANLWLEDPRGRVKILDFGLARPERDDAQLTQSGAIVGTPAFMAPEQAEGQTVDARCDLFSLGCVLYRMSTGQLPFKGVNTTSTLLAVATMDPTPPRELNPELPPPLSDLVMQLLAKNPTARTRTAAEVVVALEAIERGSLPQATILGSSLLPDQRQASSLSLRDDTQHGCPANQPVSRRRRWLVVAAAAVVLFLLLGGALALYKLTYSTSQGTFIVQIDDKDVEARFKNGKLELRGPDGQVKYTLSPSERNKKLPIGEYKIRVVGADGLTVDIDKFTMEKNGEVTVSVVFVPEDGIEPISWRRKELVTVVDQKGPRIGALAFSGDGKWLACGGDDKSLRLWNLNGPSLKEFPALRIHSPVKCIAFSRDGKKLACGTDDGPIHIWQLTDSGTEPKYQYAVKDNGPFGSARGVAFSPDGKQLASTYFRRPGYSWFLWDLTAEKALKRDLPTADKFMSWVAFSPNGKSLAALGTVADDKPWTIRLLDLTKEEPDVRAKFQADGAVFAPDSSTLATWTHGGAIQLWDLTEKQPKKRILPDGLKDRFKDIVRMVYTPDGRTLLSLHQDGVLRYWNTTSGKNKGFIKLSLPRKFTQVAFSHDCGHLAVANPDGAVNILRIAAQGK
jgi:serine/threonine protein kinase/WD40 repeat protein